MPATAFWHSIPSPTHAPSRRRTDAEEYKANTKGKSVADLRNSIIRAGQRQELADSDSSLEGVIYQQLVRHGVRADDPFILRRD